MVDGRDLELSGLDFPESYAPVAYTQSPEPTERTLEGTDITVPRFCVNIKSPKNPDRNLTIQCA